MAKIHQGRFVAEFVMIYLNMANGEKRRALVMAQADIPGSPNHVLVGLILEDGLPMTQKVIPRVDFQEAQLKGQTVTLVESKNERGRLALIGDGGAVITSKD